MKNLSQLKIRNRYFGHRPITYGSVFE